MIRKVQALWRQADDAAATESEKETFVSKARELMAKYAIDELVLEESSGVKEAIVMADIKVFDEGKTTLVPDQRIYLAHVIGTHNRCKSVIRRMPASVDAETGAAIKAGTYLTVVGFRSDTITVRLLYQAIGADMIFAMTEEPTDHMTKKQRENYFVNFCDGFVYRIDQRLKDINRRVHTLAEETQGSTGSMALVLASKELEVANQFQALFPQLGKAKVSRFQHDPNAQARGAAAADKTNLGGTGVGSGGPKGAIGG